MSGVVPIVTTTLGASPEIAAKVISGLATGTYERVGGVIRRADNHQVVTWLESVTDAPVVPPQLLPLLGVTGATSILTLGVTVLGFGVVLRRLNGLEKRLGSLERGVAQVDLKIMVGFYANFRAAVRSASRALGMTDAANRRSALRAAADRALESQEAFLLLVDNELAQGGRSVTPLLGTAMLSCAAGARCYLETGDIVVARQHLEEGLKEVSGRVDAFYDTVIRPKPAAYLCPELASRITLARVAKLLRRHNSQLTDSEAFEQLRPDIWKIAAAGPSSWLGTLPPCLWDPAKDNERKLRGWIPLGDPGLKKLFDRLGDAFEGIEQCYESMDRLLGFQAEIAYMLRKSVTFDEWRQRAPPSGADDSIFWVLPTDSELNSPELKARVRSRTRSAGSSGPKPH